MFYISGGGGMAGELGWRGSTDCTHLTVDCMEGGRVEPGGTRSIKHECIQCHPEHFKEEEEVVSAISPIFRW